MGNEAKSIEMEQYLIEPEVCLKHRREDSTSAVIIDLRSQEAYMEDHLMGAYSIPADFLSDYVGQMPTYVKIILYAGDDDTVAKEAVKLLLENDIKDLHYVVGGYENILNKMKTLDDEIFLTDFPPDQWETQITQVIQEQVIPTLEADGGGLTVEKVEGDNVFIQYQGACNGCPSSTAGELKFIKNTLGISLNHDVNVEVL